MRKLYMMVIAGVMSASAGYASAVPGIATPPGTPVFDPIAPLCECGPAPVLPTTSNNGYTGTWSPAMIDPCLVGTFLYTFTPDAGQDAVSVSLTITINPAPQPPATMSVQYCQNGVASPLTSAGSNLLWYPSASGGFGSAVAPTPDTSIAGITTYYVTQTVSGCESSRGTVNVTVVARPQAPATFSVVYCQYEIAAALTASGSDLLWYSQASGGTGTAIAPTPNTTTVGSVAYYVSQTVNGCESSRAVAIVTVNEMPELNLSCDGGLSSSTLGFDWTVVPNAAGYTITYSIDNGPLVTQTQSSPSNYTVTGLTGGQSVTMTVTTIGAMCDGSSTVTCTTLATDTFMRNAYGVAPNPVHDALCFTGDFTGTVRIFDVTGCLIGSGFIRDKNGSFAMNGLAAGVYLVQLESDTVVETFRVVKAD